jgi:HPt (histidine-containing phosphotransfer) domain-containing protein
MKRVIDVDADLIELIPLYLQNRRDEVPQLNALLDAGDFTSLWGIAHKLHGSGGGFGFDFLTELGVRMEKSAKACDKAGLYAQVAELKDFLDSVEVRSIPTA